VVTSGQFLIDSESRLREAVQQMVAEGTDAEPAQDTRATTPARAPAGE
jgi:hypothetical protein